MRRLTISSKSPVNGLSMQTRTASGRASCGEGVSGIGASPPTVSPPMVLPPADRRVAIAVTRAAATSPVYLLTMQAIAAPSMSSASDTATNVRLRTRDIHVEVVLFNSAPRVVVADGDRGEISANRGVGPPAHRHTNGLAAIERRRKRGADSRVALKVEVLLSRRSSSAHL